MRRKTKRVIIIALLATVLLVAIGGTVYINTYYYAGESAVQAMVSSDQVTVNKTEEGAIVFAPSRPSAGMIFYPGGKVEYTAYSPLMRVCAECGLLCVLVKMPCNLAVLDSNAADGIAEQYPEIRTWYIGGHSLGGAMAASYAATHSGEIDGLILLAAYSTKDLSDLKLTVLSLYGSEDQVLNKEKYEGYKKNLPASMVEVIIEGGCHAGFGVYGPQDGDGIPTITSEEQIIRTAEEICSAFSTREQLH